MTEHNDCKKYTLNEIWAKAYKIKCDKWTKEKGNFSYLPWNRAWKIVVETFADTNISYQFNDNEVHGDGSVTVHSVVTISECSLSMWMPVMNYNNKAIPNPDARQIQDSKMRCFVKNLAMFGIGFHLFQGSLQPEDTWKDNNIADGKASKKISLKQEQHISNLTRKWTKQEKTDFASHFNFNSTGEILSSEFERIVAAIGTKNADF
jgi:hypothetical protein|tara:strand:+ start:302 stop:919 length:618 start_codon:yes stop_codon:yes gene_type:complete